MAIGFPIFAAVAALLLHSHSHVHAHNSVFSYQIELPFALLKLRFEAIFVITLPENEPST
jgi:hypothetical protein